VHSRRGEPSSAANWPYKVNAMPKNSCLVALWSILAFGLCLSNKVAASSLSVIVNNSSSAYDQRFAEGCRQAGIDLKADIHFYQYTPASDNGLIKLIQFVDSANPDSIVLAVRAVSDLDLIVKEAAPKARIVLANFHPASETKIPFVTWDEKWTGAVAADSFASAFQQSKGKIGGDVLVIKPEIQDQIVDDRVDGFRSQLAARYPGIKVTTREVSSYSADKSIAEALASKPDLDGVFIPDFTTTADVTDAVHKDAKLMGIRIVGTSTDDWSTFKNNVPNLAGSDFVIQDPYALGYQSVYRALNFSGELVAHGATSYIQAATVVPGKNIGEQFKDWGLVAGPGLSDDDQILHILYATNRALVDSNKQIFSGEIDKRTNYGIAYVRVPERHLFGQLETKQQWDGSDAQASVFMLKKRQGMTSDNFKSTIISSTVKTAVIFVPGFHNNFDDSLFRFAQIIWDGQLRDMIPVLFSWPSRDDLKDYIYDGESATNSVDAFEKLILFLQNDCKVTNINVIAHSMGNRVVVAALADLAKHNEITTIGELVLAAADVNTNEFNQKAELIEEAAYGVTLYVSSSDRALELSEGVAQMPRVGKVDSDGPLIIDGVDSIDVTNLGDDIFGLNHGTYSDSPVVEDIARLIRFHNRPPNIRTPRIRGIPEGSDHPRYWKYSP
jgi:esterase/lipase superfamily enzyme/ABC-type sugar transport system substrate-binding protein